MIITITEKEIIEEPARNVSKAFQSIIDRKARQAVDPSRVTKMGVDDDRNYVVEIDGSAPVKEVDPVTEKILIEAERQYGRKITEDEIKSVKADLSRGTIDVELKSAPSLLYVQEIKPSGKMTIASRIESIYVRTVSFIRKLFYYFWGKK